MQKANNIDFAALALGENLALVTADMAQVGKDDPKDLPPTSGIAPMPKTETEILFEVGRARRLADAMIEALQRFVTLENFDRAMTDANDAGFGRVIRSLPEGERKAFVQRIAKIAMKIYLNEKSDRAMTAKQNKGQSPTRGSKIKKIGKVQISKPWLEGDSSGSGDSFMLKRFVDPFLNEPKILAAVAQEMDLDPAKSWQIEFQVVGNQMTGNSRSVGKLMAVAKLGGKAEKKMAFAIKIHSPFAMMRSEGNPLKLESEVSRRFKDEPIFKQHFAGTFATKSFIIDKEFRGWMSTKHQVVTSEFDGKVPTAHFGLARWVEGKDLSYVLNLLKDFEPKTMSKAELVYLLAGKIGMAVIDGWSKLKMKDGRGVVYDVVGHDDIFLEGFDDANIEDSVSQSQVVFIDGAGGGYFVEKSQEVAQSIQTLLESISRVTRIDLESLDVVFTKYLGEQSTQEDEAMLVQIDPHQTVSDESVRKANQAIERALKLFPDLDKVSEKAARDYLQSINPILRIKEGKSLVAKDEEYKKIRTRALEQLLDDTSISRKGLYNNAKFILLSLKRSVMFYQFSPLQERDKPLTSEEAIDITLNELNLKPKLKDALRHYLVAIDIWLRAEREAKGEPDPIGGAVKRLRKTFLQDDDFYYDQDQSVRTGRIFKIVDKARDRIYELKGYFFEAGTGRDEIHDEAMVGSEDETEKVARNIYEPSQPISTKKYGQYNNGFEGFAKKNEIFEKLKKMKAVGELEKYKMADGRINTYWLGNDLRNALRKRVNVYLLDDWLKSQGIQYLRTKGNVSLAVYYKLVEWIEKQENKKDFIATYGGPAGMLRMAVKLNEEDGALEPHLGQLSTMMLDVDVVGDLLGMRMEELAGWKPKRLDITLAQMKLVEKELRRAKEKGELIERYGGPAGVLKMAVKLNKEDPRLEPNLAQLSSMMLDVEVVGDLLGIKKEELAGWKPRQLNISFAQMKLVEKELRKVKADGQLIEMYGGPAGVLKMAVKLNKEDPTLEPNLAHLSTLMLDVEVVGDLLGIKKEELAGWKPRQLNISLAQMKLVEKELRNVKADGQLIETYGGPAGVLKMAVKLNKVDPTLEPHLMQLSSMMLDVEVVGDLLGIKKEELAGWKPRKLDITFAQMKLVEQELRKVKADGQLIETYGGPAGVLKMAVKLNKEDPRLEPNLAQLSSMMLDVEVVGDLLGIKKEKLAGWRPDSFTMTFTKFKAMLAKDEKLRNTLEVKSIEETTPDSAMVVRLDPDMVVTEDDVKKINQAILRAINIYPNLDSGTKSNLIRQFQRLNPVLRIKHKKKILPDDAEFNEIRGKVIYFIMKDANIGKSLNYPEAYKIFLRIKRAVNFYQFSPLNNRKEPVTAEEAIGMAVDELNLKPKLSQELKNYLATIDPWIRFERDSVGQIDPIKVIVETFHSAFLADREFYPSESDAIRIDMIYKLVKAAKKRVNEFKGYYFTSDESKSVPGSDEAMVAKNKGPIIFDLKSQILRDDLVKFNEYDQMGFFLFMLETLMKHRVATTDRDAIKQLLDEAYDDLNFSVNIFKKGDAEAVQNPSVDLPAIPEYRTIVQMASYYLFGVVLDEDDFIKELIAGKSPMFDAMKEAWSIKIEIDQVVKPKATFGDILKKWHGITRNWNATSGSLVPESIHEINSDQNFDLLSRALNIAMGRMPTTDAAMMAENKGPISVFDKGGIDLNPNAMNMRVQREGKGVAMPKMLSPKKFADVEGFRPVIINVVPIINLPQLMGQNTKPKDSPAPKAAFYAPFEESREVVMMGKL